MESFLQWSEQEHKQHDATYRRYKTSSNALLLFFRKNVDQITPADIEAYKTRRAAPEGKEDQAHDKARHD